MKRFFQLTAPILAMGLFAFTIAPTSAQDKEPAKKSSAKDDESKSVQDLIRDAIEKINNDDMKGAIDIFEKAHLKEPKNRRTLRFYLTALMQQGMAESQDERKKGSPYFYKAAKVAREHLTHAEDKIALATMIYNEACSYAIDGKKELALKSLKESFASGFEDFENVDGDKDFDSIKNTKEFKELVSNAKKEAAERKVKLVKESIANFDSYKFDFSLADVKTKKTINSKLLKYFFIFSYSCR